LARDACGAGKKTARSCCGRCRRTTRALLLGAPSAIGTDLLRPAPAVRSAPADRRASLRGCGYQAIRTRARCSPALAHLPARRTTRHALLTQARWARKPCPSSQRKRRDLSTGALGDVPKIAPSVAAGWIASTGQPWRDEPRAVDPLCLVRASTAHQLPLGPTLTAVKMIGLVGPGTRPVSGRAERRDRPHRAQTIQAIDHRHRSVGASAQCGPVAAMRLRPRGAQVQT
jgi:hypothetical protein